MGLKPCRNQVHIGSPVTKRKSYPSQRVIPPCILNGIFSAIFDLVPSLVPSLVLIFSKHIRRTDVGKWEVNPHQIWGPSQMCSEHPDSTSRCIALFRTTSRGLGIWKVQWSWDFKHFMIPKHRLYLRGVVYGSFVDLFSTSGSTSAALSMKYGIPPAYRPQSLRQATNTDLRSCSGLCFNLFCCNSNYWTTRWLLFF